LSHIIFSQAQNELIYGDNIEDQDSNKKQEEPIDDLIVETDLMIDVLDIVGNENQIFDDNFKIDQTLLKLSIKDQNIHHSSSARIKKPKTQMNGENQNRDQYIFMSTRIENAIKPKYEEQFSIIPQDMNRHSMQY